MTGYLSYGRTRLRQPLAFTVDPTYGGKIMRYSITMLPYLVIKKRGSGYFRDPFLVIKRGPTSFRIEKSMVLLISIVILSISVL